MHSILGSSRIIPRVCVLLCNRGKASSNWPLKRPRSYRRRLYDAALAPMVPKVPTMCPSFKEMNEEFERLKSSYSAYDLALVERIRERIKSEGYQFMGICHRLAVKQREEWLTWNKLRLKGLECYDYGNRIMRKLFEGTPLQSLNNTVFVATNCQVFGKDINAIRMFITECSKIDWMIPIALVYGSRIMSVSEAKELCSLPSMEDHRAQTVHLLSRPATEFISTTTYHMNDLIRILDSIKELKKSSNS